MSYERFHHVISPYLSHNKTFIPSSVELSSAFVEETVERMEEPECRGKGCEAVRNTSRVL